MISMTVCYCNSTASLLVFSTDMAVATAVEIQGVMKKKNNPKLLAFLQGKSLKLTHTSVVFDFAKMGILINLMTPDTTTYLNDLMTE